VGAQVNRAAWLAWRREGLGGSDVAAVLGVSPWSTPLQVWLERTDPDALPSSDTPAFARGRRLEVAVLAWLADELGGTVEPGRPVIGPHPLRASPDAYVVLSDGRRVGAEAKTSRDPPWDAIPVYYELQCRHYLACTGLSSWWLACFFLRHDEWRRWEIVRDPEIEAALVARCHEWWDRHIVRGTPPELSGPAAIPYLRHRHPEGAGWLTGGASEAETARAYLAASEEVRAAEARRDACGVALRARIGDHQGLRAGGYRTTWTRYERRHLDTAALRRDHPELVARYESQRPADRLTVTHEDP
jgi:putative phage-type endonuclease